MTQNHRLKTLFLISMPTMIITLSRTMMQFVDFLFVSALGTDAVAAISPAAITAWVVIGFGMGTTSIVGTFAAQSFGKGNVKESSGYLWQSIYISLFFGVLGVACIPLARPIFMLYGHAPNVLALEVEFTEAILWSTGPSVLSFAIQSYLVAVQRPWSAMYAALVSNIVNIIFDYLLIHGLYGFPQLGISGAAYATVLATVVQTLISFYYISHKKFRSEFHSWDQTALNFKRMWDVLKLGAPVGVTWIVDIVSWAIFTSLLVGGFGTIHLAASNICLQFLHLSFMPAMGIGQAAGALVGEAIGAKRFTEAIRITNLATILAMLWMGVLGLTAFFAGGPLIGLINNDAAVMSIGAIIFRFAAFYQLFDAVAIVTSHALRAAGDTMFPTVLTVSANWFIFILGGYLMTHYLPEWGSAGPWLMGTLMIIFIGIAFRIRFTMGRWQSMNIFGAEP